MERPKEIETVWQNKKPQQISLQKVHDYFSFKITRETVQAESTEENGHRAVHLTIGSMDVFEPLTNTLQKTTLYGIVPHYVRFGEELSIGGPRRFCEVTLLENRNTDFRRIIEVLYERFRDQVQDYVLERLNKDIKVDSFDIDVTPLFDNNGIMKLGVTEMAWTQNVQADVVLGPDSFRSIGLYVGCAWIRIVTKDNKAIVKAGIKWNISLRPKRRAAVVYKREFAVVSDEKEQEVKAEPEKKKQRRKRRKKEEEEEKEEKEN